MYTYVQDRSTNSAKDSTERACGLKDPCKKHGLQVGSQEKLGKYEIIGKNNYVSRTLQKQESSLGGTYWIES